MGTFDDPYNSTQNTKNPGWKCRVRFGSLTQKIFSKILDSFLSFSNVNKTNFDNYNEKGGEDRLFSDRKPTTGRRIDRSHREVRSLNRWIEDPPWSFPNWSVLLWLVPMLFQGSRLPSMIIPKYFYSAIRPLRGSLHPSIQGRTFTKKIRIVLIP